VSIEYAIQIDGATTVLGRISFVAFPYDGTKSDGLRQYAHFSKVISNVAAGAHTIKVRWRIASASGCGLVNADSDDYFQITIIEGGL
jgi:hypothetical protein